MMARPLLQIRKARDDEHGREAPPVAEQGCFADVLIHLERVLDRLRRDELAA